MYAHLQGPKWQFCNGPLIMTLRAVHVALHSNLAKISLEISNVILQHKQDTSFTFRHRIAIYLGS